MPKFKPLYRIALHRGYNSGILTWEEYLKAMEPLRWPIRRNRNTGSRVYVLDSVRDYVYDNMRKEGIELNWSDILQWIKDNWPAIIKFIITLLIFLDPPPQAR